MKLAINIALSLLMLALCLWLVWRMWRLDRRRP